MYLSFPVNSNDPSSGFMWGSDENGLPTDPVHVDASSGLQIIQVDVAILCDEKNDILLGADLDVPKERKGSYMQLASKCESSGSASNHQLDVRLPEKWFISMVIQKNDDWETVANQSPTIFNKS